MRQTIKEKLRNRGIELLKRSLNSGETYKVVIKSEDGAVVSINKSRRWVGSEESN